MPADQPLRKIFKGHERANHSPIHGPFVEIRLGDGAVGQGLEGGIAREEKCKPGAVKRLVGIACESARDKPEHTRDGGYKHGKVCGCVPPKVVR